MFLFSFAWLVMLWEAPPGAPAQLLCTWPLVPAAAWRRDSVLGIWFHPPPNPGAQLWSQPNPGLGEAPAALLHAGLLLSALFMPSGARGQLDPSAAPQASPVPFLACPGHALTIPSSHCKSFFPSAVTCMWQLQPRLYLVSPLTHLQLLVQSPWAGRSSLGWSRALLHENWESALQQGVWNQGDPPAGENWLVTGEMGVPRRDGCSQEQL